MVPVDVERNIRIPGTDLQIYGTYREVSGAPLVIFSHCLGSDRNTLEYYNGAQAMSEAGFSSYRFDYYGYDDNARNLVDCVVPDHVADLDLVVKTFKDEEPDRPITVIGHSLGGLVTLMSERQQFDAAVLWDATHTSAWEHPEQFEDEHTVWEPSLNLFRMRWGVDILMSRDYLASYRLLDCDALAARFMKPLLVIAAGYGSLVEGAKHYVSNAKLGKGPIVIEKADHNFTNFDSLARLLEITTSQLRSTAKPNEK